MEIELDDIKNLVVIGYTLWKWRKEIAEKQKKRPQVKHRKRKPVKRSQK